MVRIDREIVEVVTVLSASFLAFAFFAVTARQLTVLAAAVFLVGVPHVFCSYIRGENTHPNDKKKSAQIDITTIVKLLAVIVLMYFLLGSLRLIGLESGMMNFSDFLLLHVFYGLPVLAALLYFFKRTNFSRLFSVHKVFAVLAIILISGTGIFLVYKDVLLVGLCTAIFFLVLQFSKPWPLIVSASALTLFAIIAHAILLF